MTYKKATELSKSSMEDCTNLLNHTRATPLRVVEKDWHIISSRVCYKFKVILKVVMWSSWSFNPSYDSSYGSQNLGESGWSRTCCVNGEFVILTIPSKFLAVFPFMEFFELVHLFSHTPQKVIAGLVRSLRPPWSISPLASFWTLHLVFVPIVFDPSWWAVLLLL